MEKWQAQCVLLSDKIDIIPCATDGFNAVLGKSGFYEQVIHVKGFSVFLSWRFGLFLLFCCSWSAYYSPPCFYSHFW